ncbi:fimbrial protein [Pseudomonas sp. AM4(2022)]|uniref:fimbrial protein n=1 Tax=Pseudomonas sp. AM4(2022) TaxID=2983408 RepID=UPI002E816320|nr:fimbrial protein [Pseudomonas sp. AM4(2022)]
MRKLLLVSAFFSSNLFAETTCTFDNGTILTPALTLAARDVTLPAVISNSWHEVSGVVGTCKESPSKTNFYTLANNSAGNTGKTLNFEGETYDIYRSGVNGVGIIMAAGDTNARYLPFASSEIRMWNSNTADAPPVAGSKFRIRFVVTERLKPGIINIPSVAVMRYGFFINGYYGWGSISAQGTSLDVKYPVCKLSLPATIKLPKVDIGALENEKSTTGETPFSIDLDCGAGASNVNVKYTLTDISSPTNTSSTLELAKVPDSASGFAIQVMENGLPVSFGPDSSAIGTINQRDFGKITSVGGHLKKSFTVRYHKTATHFVAGKVNAGMTITMSYQ